MSKQRLEVFSDWRPGTGDVALPSTCRDPQSVAIEILDVALAAGETVLIDRYSELAGHSLDVVHIEVNEAFRRSVTRVFRQVKPKWSPTHRNEPRKARLELVLPLLREAEPSVPSDSLRRVHDA